MTIRFLRGATLAGVLAALVLAGPRETQAAPPDKAVFEVSTRGSLNSDAMWCAAADYARRGLGAGWRDKVYVARGRAAPSSGRGAAILFTLDPAAAGIEPIPDGQGFDSLAVGYSMSVQRANALCNMPPDR